MAYSKGKITGSNTQFKTDTFEFPGWQYDTDHLMLTFAKTTSITSKRICFCENENLVEWDTKLDAEKKCKCKNITSEELHQTMTEELQKIRDFHRATSIGELDSQVDESTMPIYTHNQPKRKIENVIAYMANNTIDAMSKTIHKLKLENSIVTNYLTQIEARHLDKVCGTNEIETTNSWTLSLLPNRQIRLEDKDGCYRFYFINIPSFEEKVSLEACLVPGGHLFRLTFAMTISDEIKDAWLVITDRRWVCNESVFSYMISHPYGLLESVRSKLRIAFLKDPKEANKARKTVECFDCYYSQRHFYYKAVNRQFSGEMLIGKWAVRGDRSALFFRPEGASKNNTDFLMALASDVTWFRAWKAVIYADFKDSENAGWIIRGNMKELIKGHQATPLISDFLSVRRLLKVSSLSTNESEENDGFVVAKFVFDCTSRQLTSVNLESRKECFEAHRIIAKPEIEETDDEYDFRLFGCNLKTRDAVDIMIRVVIPENLPGWKSILPLPLSHVYVFLEVLLRELSEKNATLGDIKSHAQPDDSFEEFHETFSLLPKFEMVEVLVSHFSPSRLEKFVFLTLDALYHPLISLSEAKEIVEKKKQLSDVCQSESVHIMQLIHRHVHGFNIGLLHSETNKSKPQSKLNVWMKLMPHYLRISEIYLDKWKNLIKSVAKYFDEAPYGFPNKV